MSFFHHTLLTLLVNPTSTHKSGTLDLGAAVGVSGAVEVVTLGQVTRSSALISPLGPFELGSDAASEVTLHDGTAFESDEVGVVPRASSLAQGQGDLGNTRWE